MRDPTGTLRRLIESHNLQRHPDVANVLTLIDLGLLPDGVAESLLMSYSRRVQDAIDHPNPLHRAPHREELYPEAGPDVEIGHLADKPDVPWGIRLDRARSLVVTGNSGSGKTTALLNLLKKLDQLGQRDPSKRVSFIIFDKKLDYTHLPDELGSHWLRMSVHDGLRVGLNAPEGVPVKAWINIVATIFAANTRMIAAWTTLVRILQWLLVLLNPEGTPPLRWPSLGLVLEVVNAAPDRAFSAKEDYSRTLRQALAGATHAVDTFDCFSGLDLERDVIQPGKSLVLETHNVSPAWVRQLIQELLTAQLIDGRIHRHQKVDRGVQAIVVADEADQDVTIENDLLYPDKMSKGSALLRFGREFGVEAWIGVSRLGGLSEFARLEAQYLMTFNQSDADSIYTASKTLLLPRGAEQMLPALPPGTCIAREAGGWPHPVLVKVDYQHPGRGPAVRRYDDHPFMEALGLDQLSEVQAAIVAVKTPKRPARDTPRGDEPLPPHSHALLHAAAVHPYTPVARLWEAAGQVPSPESQNTARTALERRQLAAFEEIRCGRRNMLLIRVTKPGWAYLGRDAPPANEQVTLGHEFLAHSIHRVGCARGHDSHLEYRVPGSSHIADVAWIIDGAPHTIECVATCTRNLKGHIRACFVESNAVATLTIVPFQKAIVEKLRKQLEADPDIAPHLERVRWDVAETFVRELWP